MNNHVLGIAREVIVMAIVISVILLVLGIGVLVFIHACIVGSSLGRGTPTSEGGNASAVERGSCGSTSMSRDDIEKLPCFDFKAKEAKGSSPAADCAVCLENFRAGEKCRLLPGCSHSFHAECVDLWLLRTPICPICRAGADCVDAEESSVFDVISPCSNNGGEPGLNRTVEDRAGEVLDSSARVVEVRERQEN